MKDNLPTSSSASNYSYKPFIKNITIDQTTQDRRKSGDTGTNKTFFSNIKAELNSIRTDVNKLVSKDASKPLYLNANKSYTAQKIQSPVTTQFSADRNNQERKSLYDPIQRPSSTYALEAKISQLTSKLNFQTNKNEEITHHFEQERKNQGYLRDQISKLREKQSNLQYQVACKNKEIENLRQQCDRLYHEKEEYARIAERAQFQLKKKPEITIQRINVPDPQAAQKIREQQITIDNLFADLDRIQEQNHRLRYDLDNFEKTKQIQIVANIKNYEEKLNRAEAKTYKQLGAGFEVKINDLLDENYSLKNKITSLESQIQQQRVKMQSLTSTVQAYEARDRETGKGANQIQLQKLREKVMQLQEQKDKLESEHEYEIMKLENFIDELKQNKKEKNDNKSFNQILKDQINEIENLKEKLREKNETINKMRR